MQPCALKFLWLLRTGCVSVFLDYWTSRARCRQQRSPGPELLLATATAVLRWSPFTSHLQLFHSSRWRSEGQDFARRRFFPLPDTRLASRPDWMRPARLSGLRSSRKNWRGLDWGSTARCKRPAGGLSRRWPLPSRSKVAPAAAAASTSGPTRTPDSQRAPQVM